MQLIVRFRGSCKWSTEELRIGTGGRTKCFYRSAFWLPRSQLASVRVPESADRPAQVELQVDTRFECSESFQVRLSKISRVCLPLCSFSRKFWKCPCLRPVNEFAKLISPTTKRIYFLSFLNRGANHVSDSDRFRPSQRRYLLDTIQGLLCDICVSFTLWKIMGTRSNHKVPFIKSEQVKKDCKSSIIKQLSIV